MTLRCKPGDTAIVVRNILGIECVERDLGRPVVVDQAHPTALGLAVWTVKGNLRCACGFAPLMFFDADLQPIRGQGKTTDTPVEKPVEVAHG